MPLCYYQSPNGTRIAYHYTSGKTIKNTLGVVFLGGFCSNMDGIKARHLEQVCTQNGQAYLRFDYSGHGKSDGKFENGTIGLWIQDATDIISYIYGKQPVILIGSSMGGWIALRLLLNRSIPIKGIIGIAAAPDFTRDFENQITPQDHQKLANDGYLKRPSNYAHTPCIYTHTLLEEGKQQTILNKIHTVHVPIVLLHGKQDTDVPWKKAYDTASAFNGPDTRVILIEKGDHRLSKPENLHIIEAELTKISVRHID